MDRLCELLVEFVNTINIHVNGHALEIEDIE
jgi:hypothetical protein